MVRVYLYCTVQAASQGTCFRLLPAEIDNYCSYTSFLLPVPRSVLRSCDDDVQESALVSRVRVLWTSQLVKRKDAPRSSALL